VVPIPVSTYGILSYVAISQSMGVAAVWDVEPPPPACLSRFLSRRNVVRYKLAPLEKLLWVCPRGARYIERSFRGLGALTPLVDRRVENVTDIIVAGDRVYASTLDGRQYEVDIGELKEGELDLVLESKGEVHDRYCNAVIRRDYDSSYAHVRVHPPEPPWGIHDVAKYIYAAVKGPLAIRGYGKTSLAYGIIRYMPLTRIVVSPRLEYKLDSTVHLQRLPRSMPKGAVLLVDHPDVTYRDALALNPDVLIYVAHGGEGVEEAPSVLHAVRSGGGVRVVEERVVEAPSEIVRLLTHTDDVGRRRIIGRILSGLS